MRYYLTKLLAVTPKSRLQYRSGADVFLSMVMVNDAETKYQLSVVIKLLLSCRTCTTSYVDMIPF